MSNYAVVIFKNKSLKKILKEFITFEKAKSYFEDLKKKSDEVLFDVIFENGKSCRYEIALIENSNSKLIPVYLTDEMGRSQKVKLAESGKTISEISLYKKEEKIFDLSKNKKIFTQEFIKNYIKGDNVKLVSCLNNKIIVQNDDEFKLFSLKNELEVGRFLDFLTSYLQKKQRKDCLIVKDTSTAQKKYLLELLSSKGFDKKVLYRKNTTHPR